MHCTKKQFVQNLPFCDTLRQDNWLISRNGLWISTGYCKGVNIREPWQFGRHNQTSTIGSLLPKQKQTIHHYFLKDTRINELKMHEWTLIRCCLNDKLQNRFINQARTVTETVFPFKPTFSRGEESEGRPSENLLCLYYC